MINMKRSIGIIGLVASLSGAHLIDNSLEPKGAATLTVGQVVAIKWTADINHPTNKEGIDIGFSKDGGATWQILREGFGDNEKNNTFNWTVPASAVTAQGKFRICQSGPCTDAQNKSNAQAERPPWVLVSPTTFTVQSSTGMATPAQSAEGLSIDFLAQTGNVDASFALARPGEVRLQAFDAQGRLIATLIQGKYAAGSHKVSAFSNRLASTSGSLMFKLDADGVSKTLMSLR